jgi:hypothetical protein
MNGFLGAETAVRCDEFFVSWVEARFFFSSSIDLSIFISSLEIEKYQV